MESPSNSETAQRLPVDAVARCTRQAQKDGVFAGLSAGLVGAILGSRLFRFNRNTTVVCGVVTGVLAGYQFTQAFLSTNLALLEAERRTLLETSNQGQVDEPL